MWKVNDRRRTDGLRKTFDSGALKHQNEECRTYKVHYFEANYTRKISVQMTSK